MKYALIQNDRIANLIAYDGVAPYTPPPGMTLAQVPDEAAIGDSHPS